MKLDLTSPVSGVPWDEPVSVAPSATVRQAANVLVRYNVGAVVVRADDLVDAGIVSERDVVRLVAAGGDPDRIPVRDVMAPDLITVEVTAELSEVARAMLDNGVRHVALTDGDEVVGVLSAREVLRLLSDEGSGYDG